MLHGCQHTASKPGQTVHPQPLEHVEQQATCSHPHQKTTVFPQSDTSRPPTTPLAGCISHKRWVPPRGPWSSLPSPHPAAGSAQSAKHSGLRRSQRTHTVCRAGAHACQARHVMPAPPSSGSGLREQPASQGTVTPSWRASALMQGAWGSVLLITCLGLWVRGRKRGWDVPPV